jgi:hypothetical protein
MEEPLLFFGCLAVLAAYAGLILRCGTALLGLNGLNLFMVGTSMLSGFFVSELFGRPMPWFSAEHAQVVTYGIFGSLAMIGGIYAGWRPLRRAAPGGTGATALGQSGVPGARLGWLTFWLGAAFEALAPIAAQVPTLSTAVNSLSSLDRIGLMILLWSALQHGRWARFCVALLVFLGISVVTSFTSGFSFLRINALLPLGLIWLFARGINPRALLLMPALAAALIAATTAWLDSRALIREGTLEGLPATEKFTTFFGEYFAALSRLDVDALISGVFDRVDMTMIYAEQVRYQPDIEPYAYGETVWSSFYTLIPRALWPEKPEVAGGSEFVARFAGIGTRGDETSIGLPYPFELYANGGPLVVIAGLALIGFLAARLELQLFRGHRSLGLFWALAVATVVVCDGGQRTDVVLPALVAAALCAYALGWLIQRRSPEYAAQLLRGDLGSAARIRASFPSSRRWSGLVRLRP